MQKIEHMLYQCLKNSVNVILEKIIKPTRKYEDITQIKREDMIEMKEKYGIGGIILDIDGTVKNFSFDVSRRTAEWISLLKKEFKICIVSNALEQRVKKVADQYDIDYISFAKKPFRKSFYEASNRMGLELENVMVIGNSLTTDIYGGNRNLMPTILVKAPEEREK